MRCFPASLSFKLYSELSIVPIIVLIIMPSDIKDKYLPKIVEGK